MRRVHARLSRARARYPKSRRYRNSKERSDTMLLTQAQIEQFDAEGYLFLPNLFTPEETRILCAEALESEHRDNSFAISDKAGSAALSLWIETRDDPLGALVRH